MNELALFAGCGGGLLASHLLGFRTAAIVERSKHRRDVLHARMRDGLLSWPDMPIHDDVCTFEARPGCFDIVTGGFPCRPFSTAARGRNNAVDLWPEMLRIIDECRPHSVFAENVQRKPIERAAQHLSSRGFRAAITRCSAAEMGAPHRRPRWWLLAHANEEGQRLCAEHAEMARARLATAGLWSEPGPEILGADDGVAHRMDRLGAIGDGQVPAVAVLAFCKLAGGLD